MQQNFFVTKNIPTHKFVHTNKNRKNASKKYLITNVVDHITQM